MNLDISQEISLWKKVTKQNIQIWGGVIKEHELLQFLVKYTFLTTAYVILETVDSIIFDKQPDFSTLDAKNVERIRLFSEAGDLDIRRDSSDFRWRYIGRENVPAGINGVDFWANETNQDQEFFEESKTALLWGMFQSESKLWQDNRVAKRRFSYPIDGTPKSIRIQYKTYSSNGVINFVWLLDIE